MEVFAYFSGMFLPKKTYKTSLKLHPQIAQIPFNSLRHLWIKEFT